MNKIIVLLIGFVLIFSSQRISAQEYDIEVTVEGVSDTTMMLGHHFGKKKYVVDTAKVGSDGKAVFSGDEALDRGIYIVVMPSQGNSYFEILIDDDQEFKIETDTADYLNNMKVKGSSSNKTFNEYQQKMSVFQKDMMELNKKLKNTKDKEQKSKIKDDIKQLNEERVAYMRSIVKDDKGGLLGTIVNSIIQVEIPEPPKDEEGNITDSTFQYRYYRDHYFDNVDFSEPGLLKTPILIPKIDNYFKNVIPPVADSVKPYANELIQTAYDSNYEMFRFMTSHLLNYFETSKIMGMDEVFVNIAEKWYLTGKADWADSTLIANIRERVEKISPNIMGNVAPNIKQVPTADGRYASLHEVDAKYTILVFWEPDCGHCKTVVPRLHKLYTDSLAEYDVEVFAMYTQVDKEKWTEFLEKKGLMDWINVYDPYGMSGFRDNYDIYSTPVIYVLDEDKKIIAKRIDVGYIEEFLKYEEKKKNSD